MRHHDTIKQYLKEDEFKVYKLIWQRFVVLQINPAVFDQTTVDIDAKSTTGSDIFWFRVTDGFLRVYERFEKKAKTKKTRSSSTNCVEAGENLRCAN